MKYMLLLVGIFFASLTLAQEADEFGSADQVATKQVNRSYAGGKEDSELKVQPSLPQPIRYLDGIKPGEENAPSAGTDRATD